MNFQRALMSTVCVLGVSAPLTAQILGGTIRGIVTDSVRVRPLAGARVSAVRVDAPEEEARFTATNDSGAYALSALAPGRYAVSFVSGLLDSLEFGGPVHQVMIANGETVTADLAIPSGRTLRRMACPGVALDAHTGVLFGVTLNADLERPVGGAHVVVAWRELASDTTSGAAFVERSAAATSDDAGQYRLCGIPSDQWLAVQMQSAGRAGTVLRTLVEDAVGVAVQNLSLSAVDAPSLASADSSAAKLLSGTATLSGTVRTTNGQPVTGAQLRVTGAASSARTNERGEFQIGSLPAGTQELEVRAIGYAEVRRAVELRSGRTAHEDIQLRRAVSLDSIKVVAKRQQYPLFETHRKENFFGYFLDAEEIMARQVVTAADLLVTMPRIGIGGVGGPHLIPMSRGATPRCAHLPTHAGELNVVIDNAPYQGIYDVRLDEIGAMEFYASPTTAPPQFEANCGLVIIWTKAMRKSSDPKPATSP
ncbi:MAG: carboxypeptidase-like regulatory domain-containing protein [Gemmatimonadota bacterium]|nr:carboxypeptidase-like regulatory domain-containing protein [Gemmatimonadota bacterium]